MQTVGQILKDARESRGWSIEKIARETKIKEKFLVALEESNWEELPNLTVASGFVRSFANVIGVDNERVGALVRREFPPSPFARREKELPLGGRTIWTPQNTIVASAVFVVLLVAGYLARQYFLFVAPPSLKVDIAPRGNEIVVSGKTSPSATLEVNRRAILLEKNGTFSVSFDKAELGDKVEIKSTSRSGKSTTKELKITN
ncbi:MAG: helix-turn-helix domain-containing protein [Patescibacteria group bacterium]